MKNAMLLLACGFILSSCSFYSVRSQEDSLLLNQEKSWLDVEYFETAPANSQEIGVVRAYTERNRGMDDVIRKMKMEAAILGGDAVTDIRIDPDFLKNKNADKKIRIDYVGKVITY